MIYVSVDIECTGLDHNSHEVLTIGAVIEDTLHPEIPINELPSFHALIVREGFKGSAFAINMNKDIIESMVQWQTTESKALKEALEDTTGYQFLREDKVTEAFFQFLYDNGIRAEDGKKYTFQNRVTHPPSTEKYPSLTSNMPKTYITVAGKNFASFDQLFLEKLPRWKQVIAIRRRIIDPAILFVDWDNDIAPPGLAECKRRASIEGIVTHDALDDAKDVVNLIRRSYTIPNHENRFYDD